MRDGSIGLVGAHEGEELSSRQTETRHMGRARLDWRVIVLTREASTAQGARRVRENQQIALCVSGLVVGIRVAMS